MVYGLKLGIWKVLSSSIEGKFRHIVEQTSDRRMKIAVLTKTRTVSCSSIIDGWQFINSGPEANARPNGGVAFPVKDGLKTYFCPISNRVAILALRVGKVNVGLLWLPCLH